MAAIVCDGQCDLGGAARASARQPAGLRAAAVPAHPAQDRRHRHVQAEEGRSGARGLQPGGDQRSDLFQRSAGQGLRAARPGAVPADRERRGAAVIASPESVLAFWREAGPEKWFKKDTCVRRRHPGALPRDLRGGRRRKTFRTGSRPPRARWRSLIVLDQFPRNMFRGDARTFAADPLARAVAGAGAGARLRPAGAAARPAVLLPAVRAFRVAGRPGAMLRAVCRDRRRRPFEMGASCTPTSSAGSAAFPTATPCSAAPRRPRSRPFSTAAASRVRPKSARRRALDVAAKSGP